MYAALILAGCLMGLVVLLLGILVFLRPLALDVFFHRLGLRKAGLRRRSVEGLMGTLIYFEGGSGRPVVLLHGAGDQAGTWAPIVRPLLRKYHLIIPDLLGHGQSGPSEGPIEIGQVLEGLQLLLDEVLGDQPLILVGNSLGAWLAFLLARVRPEQVERIFAFNGGPIRQENPGVNLLPVDREGARETMRGLMGSGARPLPGWVLDDIVRRTWAGPISRLAEAVAQMDAFLLDDKLKEINTPVDLIWGGEDDLFPPDYARRLREGLPDARLTFLPECGHMPQRECPHKVLEALLGALETSPPPQDAVGAPKMEES